MCRVLVVDDEKLVLQAMRCLMEAWGYSVEVGTSVDGAVALVVGGYRPDGMVVDYRLRGHETGAMVIAAVREVCLRTIPAIIITGDTAPERMREIGLHGHPVLTKPVPAERLRQVVRGLCGSPLDGACDHGGGLGIELGRRS